MSLQLINRTHNFFLGVWKIEELSDFFLKNIQLNAEEKKYFERITNESRKVQWLSCRHLIQNYYNNAFEVGYDFQGKPYANQKNIFISLSHTNKFSAVIISEGRDVGLDIEKVDERIRRISRKMASEKELNWISLSPDKDIEFLTSLWCSKEALYKLCGQAAVDFEKDVFVDFGSMKGDGFYDAYVQKNKFLLRRMMTEDHILVYVID
ncbi:MAG: 4'-phosphopantetheinyl transferase superfamily protein [Bacteroidales bacterium]|nr:4'-phosphopantetheinyl transferase superfamily protein [Bacteroidales bacterium]